MKKLTTAIHPDVDLDTAKIVKRLATRAIVIKNKKILLMYTDRYHDYSLPGGGLDENEAIEAGCLRELREETGARGAKVVRKFGIYEEYNPNFKEISKVIHQISYCFICSIEDGLDEPSLESYEIANGMKALWVNIDEAIEFNEKTEENDPKAGLSIRREIFLLKAIKSEEL
jgi:ADP-ribose pyrophosphatase YjhB (NUDIX family)